ncbi:MULTISPECIES: SDR family oxidoreductase [Streptomyces]|uniref:SDR family oxidoreductase n=3 Tax=Streptomyces rimosus TaxID=1927 RepID=L8EUP5_STRR1|nr:MULTISPECIES: SDR family oxidoreductase [Streptomyces]KOG75085.1 short-chain dehydrogenase [Kitasatospora aureofaciens]MYT45473.1 SDR family oxidoreductase [Streptomyces sp. SID5471]AAZ78336.1 OxyM [Streptomyces rimosus]KOT41846.1 short-chain dehydrogenase [Streptomyces sp. NRRL WC-3701]KOT44041.1 short-chain dehydrogenase [Streptomyces rimosus subsp. rimosus]
MTAINGAPAAGGSVALVIGGTRGIGLAAARKLSAAGSEVLLNYAHDEDGALAAERQLSEEGGKVRLMRADIGRPAGVVRLLEDIRRTHGRLDVLVHAAGSFHPAPTASPHIGKYLGDGAVAVGPLLYGAARLGTLMTPDTGRIVAVSSIGARTVVPGYAGLGMAKAALETLVRYLAVELAGKGVAVNAVAAGKIADGGPVPAQVLEGLLRRTPTGRLATAEEVADVVALLCRPEAGGLHGQVLTVDGGACLR